MSNILLVYPRPKYNKNPRFGFSVNLLQIASILKKAGNRTFYIDYSYKVFDANEYANYLTENEINIILVEVDTFALKRSENVECAINILEIAKKQGIKSIAVGYDCIIDKKNVIKADYVINKNPLVEIPVLFAIEGYDTYDSLPYPDRELLMTNEFFKKNPHSTLIRTAEGCLNTCTFCQRRGWQNSYKYHSNDYVIKEFKYLKECGYTNIWITDENFTFNLERAKRLLIDLIRENVTTNMKIAISSWTRVDKDFLDLAKQSNISIISMGIESANKEILKFYDKKIDLNETKKLIEYADSIGLYTVGNFIIGAPMETETTIDNTFDYISSLRLDQVNIKILDYMIGSKLYDLLDRTEQHHYFGCKENDLCAFSLDYLTQRKNIFLSQFYKENKIRLEAKFKKYGLPYEHMIL